MSIPMDDSTRMALGAFLRDIEGKTEIEVYDMLLQQAADEKTHLEAIREGVNQLLGLPEIILGEVRRNDLLTCLDELNSVAGVLASETAVIQMARDLAAGA